MCLLLGCREFVSRFWVLCVCSGAAVSSVSCAVSSLVAIRSAVVVAVLADLVCRCGCRGRCGCRAYRACCV